MKSMQLKNKKENSSSTYVALLRGINVGGNSKVEMPKLKLLFESLGFTSVKTYINSGNIIFQSRKQDIPKLQEHKKSIEKELEKTFGFPIKIVIRTASTIAKLYKQIPPEWENDTKQKTDILFLWDEYDSRSTLKLITTNKDVDTLLYIDGAIIWNISRDTYTKSGMHTFIGTAVYKHMTARNVNTVRKLHHLMQSD